MPVESCAACTARVVDGCTLCTVCTDRLAAHLAAVPEVCSELAVTLSRADKITITARRGGDAELPYKIAAGDALASLGSILIYWAGQVSRHGDRLPVKTDVAAEWLGHRLDRLRAHPVAGEAYAQIRAAMTRAWGVVDHPQNRASFKVGPCPELAEAGRYCAGEVWASIPAQRQERRASMWCRVCGAAWPPPLWRRVGQRIKHLVGSSPVA